MAKKSYSVVSVVIGGLELCLRDLCWTPTGFGNRGGRSALRGTTCNATSPSRHHGVYRNEWIAGLAWPVSALRLFYADAPRAGTGTGTGRRDRLIILHRSSGAVNRPSRRQWQSRPENLHRHLYLEPETSTHLAVRPAGMHAHEPRRELELSCASS